MSAEPHIGRSNVVAVDLLLAFAEPGVGVHSLSVLKTLTSYSLFSPNARQAGMPALPGASRPNYKPCDSLSQREYRPAARARAPLDAGFNQARA